MEMGGKAGRIAGAVEKEGAVKGWGFEGGPM